VVTILVGFDGTPESERAVHVAAEEARRRGIPLHVLYHLEHASGESPTRVRQDAATAGQATTALATVEARLRELGVDATTEVTHGVEGTAAARLLAAATERDAELLVLGYRPRSAVERFVVGSVARQVMREAPCPILTVKAEERP